MKTDETAARALRLERDLETAERENHALRAEARRLRADVAAAEERGRRAGLERAARECECTEPAGPHPVWYAARSACAHAIRALSPAAEPAEQKPRWAPGVDEYRYTPDGKAEPAACPCESDDDEPGPHLPSCPWADPAYEQPGDDGPHAPLPGDEPAAPRPIAVGERVRVVRCCAAHPGICCAANVGSEGHLTAVHDTTAHPYRVSLVGRIVVVAAVERVEAEPAAVPASEEPETSWCRTCNAVTRGGVYLARPAHPCERCRVSCAGEVSRGE